MLAVDWCFIIMAPFSDGIAGHLEQVTLLGVAFSCQFYVGKTLKG